MRGLSLQLLLPAVGEQSSLQKARLLLFCKDIRHVVFTVSTLYEVADRGETRTDSDIEKEIRTNKKRQKGEER